VSLTGAALHLFNPIPRFLSSPPRASARADATKPIVFIAGSRLVSATAATGAEFTAVAFPTITATDAGGGTPVITCEGKFKEGSLTYKADITAQFPTDTVEVSCSAKDATGNQGPSEKFTVTVCQAGTTFDGSSCAGGWGRGWRLWGLPNLFL
jgi:hypothetical protein